MLELISIDMRLLNNPKYIRMGDFVLLASKINEKLCDNGYVDYTWNCHFCEDEAINDSLTIEELTKYICQTQEIGECIEEQDLCDIIQEHQKYHDTYACTFARVLKNGKSEKYPLGIFEYLNMTLWPHIFKKIVKVHEYFGCLINNMQEDIYLYNSQNQFEFQFGGDYLVLLFKLDILSLPIDYLKFYQDENVVKVFNNILSDIEVWLLYNMLGTVEAYEVDNNTLTFTICVNLC